MAYQSIPGSPGTRRDYGMALAKGPQHVSDPLSSGGVNVHIPYSAAGGFPLHQQGFTEGHRWTEAPGKIQIHFGKSDLG